MRLSKKNERLFSRITAWTISLVMVFAMFTPVFAVGVDHDNVSHVGAHEGLEAMLIEAMADFFENEIEFTFEYDENYHEATTDESMMDEPFEVAPLGFPPHWTQPGTTTLAQGNIARIATATAQHTNGGNTPANAINGTLPTAAGNNHWNSWGAGAAVGSQESPIWFRLDWDAAYNIEGLRVMWHIFTDAGVRWPNAANVQYLNDQSQWVNIFPYTPPPNHADRIGVADPNSPIGVDGRSGANPVNRPWPAPNPWAANPVWNIIEFPEPVVTSSIRLQIFGAKTGGTAPGVGIAALEVFGEIADIDPVTLYSIGDIQVVSGDALLPGTDLKAGDIVFIGDATSSHDAMVRIQWYRSASYDGPWTAIGGATGHNYTTVAADATMYLRVGAYSNGSAILGGPVYTTAFGPMAPVPVCPADGCYRSACKVHCQTCGLIARLCQCPCPHPGCEDECQQVPGRCFGVKKTAVNWNAGAGHHRPTHSLETEHYIIIWEAQGRWLNHRPDSQYIYENHNSVWVPLEELAAEVDRIFEMFLFEMGFHDPHDRAPGGGRVNGNQIWDTYRGVFRLLYNPGWSASGGSASHPCPSCGANRTIQQFQQSVGATRPQFNPLSGEINGFPTVVHEMGHGFQATSDFRTGSFHAELHSQHSVMSMYPHVFFWEHHPLGAIDFSHRGFQGTNMIWSNPLFYEDWASNHGRDILVRLSRSPYTGDSITLYRNYFGLTHDQMGDRMFNSARRMVTWDIDSLRNYVYPFANINTSGFTNDGGEWYRVARGLAPNPYGFNAIRLEVPTYSNTVTVDFRGAQQSEFFGATNAAGGGRQFGANDHLAGWRFGFLAMTEDGTRHYGNIHSANLANREGTATFAVPANTKYLWFVVSAAPVEHWPNAHAGDANGNHTWVYDIRLGANTQFHMANVDVVYTNRVDTSVLESAITTAQSKNLTPQQQAALDAALAIGADATQAEVDTAASALIISLLNVDPVAAAAKLSAEGAINAAGGNIARVQHDGDLRVSHLRFHWDSPQGHAANVNALRNGNLGSGTWSTWAGFIDGAGPGGAVMMPFPHNSSPTPRWTEQTGWVNNNPRDRHFITMTWPHLMEIDSTRILWHSGSPNIESRTRGVAYAGFFLPGEDVYVEYLCPFTDEWVRIIHMINEMGEGVGTVGVLTDGAAFANRYWNGVAFEPVYTKGLRINMARAPFTGIFAATGATQWEIFGSVASTFSLEVINNGNSNNAYLAEMGLIRMWTQLNGENALVPYDGLHVTAILPNGDCAMQFVRVNNMLDNPGNVNLIDVSKRPAVWETIYFTATLFGQKIEITLINDEFISFVPPVPSFDIFNNGEGGSPSTPNPELVEAGIIRMWTQLDGENALVYLAATDTITAIDQDGNCAMYFIHVSRVWDDDMGWLDYFNMIDVNKNGPWQYINFTITIYGQTVELLLVNATDCCLYENWEWVQVWATGAYNYAKNYHKLYLMQREYGATRPYNIDRLWLRSNPSNSFGLLSATSGDDQITGIGLFTDGLTYKFGHGPGDYRNIYRQPNRDMPDITVTEVTWDARWHYQVADIYLTNVERTDGTVVEKYYIGQIFNKAHYVRNGFAGQPTDGFHFGIRLESNRIHIDIWLPEHIYRAEGLQVVDLTDALHNWSTARNGCPIENVGPNPRRTYTRYCAGIAIDAISTWYRRPVPCDC